MNYKYKSDFGYVGLYGINLTNLPGRVTIENQTLLRKSDFHVSIMAIKYLALMIPGLNSDEASRQLVDAFFDFVESYNMNDISLKNELRLVERDERVTIIMMVGMAFINELFEYLNFRFDVKLPVQPVHITIYTLQRDKGIGLLSQEEVESKSKIIHLQELNKVKIVND